MKILLIGKYGQLGWELQRSLAPLGEMVVVDFPEIDLADTNATRLLVRTTKPDLIVNSAAYTAVDNAESEPEICRAIKAKRAAVKLARRSTVTSTLRAALSEDRPQLWRRLPAGWATAPATAYAPGNRVCAQG